MSWGKELLADARIRNWWEENEVLLTNNLDEYVFVWITVKSCDAQGVTYPQVDGFWFLLERNSCPRDVLGDVTKEDSVFTTKVVVLCMKCEA